MFMNNAEELGFVKQTREEIVQRITKTSGICSQFKKNYKAYTSIGQQVFFLILLSTVLLVLIHAGFNAEAIINYFLSEHPERDTLLLNIAIIGISIYIVLHACKKYIIITRIGKIDGHIHAVKKIQKHLQSTLDSLTSIAGDADKLVFGSTNEKLKPTYDADTDISKYSSIARSYSNQDASILNVLLTYFHWLSGILFTGVFLLISTPYISAMAVRVMNEKMYNMVSIIYISGFFVLFMLLQELFAKNSIESIHDKIKSTVSVIFSISCICGLMVIFIIEFISLINIIKLFYTDETSSRELLSSIAIVFFPLITAACCLSIICVITDNIFSFNCFFAIIGMLFMGIIASVIGLIIALIVDNASSLKPTVLVVLVCGIAIFTVFGLFWNGFETTREIFSLHRAFWGGISGAVWGIIMWGALVFTRGCGWLIGAIVLSAVTIAIGAGMIVFFSFKGFFKYGMGGDWSDL